MKVIIQCSGSKNGQIWTVSEFDHLQVKFIAHREDCIVSNVTILTRPDDFLPNKTTTWRAYLNEHNRRGENPDRLLRAGDLYKPKTYRQLVARMGWENTYILSAGWGLVRSDYLLPNYDITFSNSAERCKRRLMRDRFEDFNHLLRDVNSEKETICFFGGKAYLPLYYSLTQNLPGRKVIFHKASNPLKVSGYDYLPYKTNRSTNWHYGCAEDFVEGKLNL